MRSRRLFRRSATAVGLLLVFGLVPIGYAPAAHADLSLFDFPCGGNALARGNFNGDESITMDSLDDLVVGSPFDGLEQEEIDGSTTVGVENAGSINVLYGNEAAPGAIPLDPEAQPPGLRHFFSQDTPGVLGDAEGGDEFGFSIAPGDFNGDGFDDVAVGIPGHEANGKKNAGAVQVFYGSSSGLNVGTPGGGGSFNQIITQQMADPFVGGIRMQGVSETDDFFGYSVAAADVGGDEADDLFIGVPGEGRGGVDDVGVVHLIYGSAVTATQGLAPSNGPSPGDSNDTYFTQDDFDGEFNASPEKGAPERGDYFGATLAVGDFNGDGEPDLAAGSPGEDIKAIPDAGAVTVAYGDGTTLDAGDGIFLHQNSVDMAGGAEAGDYFGCVLAAGNFDGDGKGGVPDDDLAIGVPGESVGSIQDAGVVQVVYSQGAVGGIDPSPPDSALPCPANCWTSDQVLSEAAGGIAGVPKTLDRFGSALTVGNFNNDAFSNPDGEAVEDLAVGVPTEELYGNERSGSVRIICGTGGFGLSDLDCTQGALDPGPPPVPSTWSQALAQNIPPTAIPPPPFASCECVQIGTPLSALTPPTYGFIGESGDLFGASLAAGDFDGDGATDDLVIGAPGEGINEDDFFIPHPPDADGQSALGETAGAGLIHVVRGDDDGAANASNPGFGNGLGDDSTHDQIDRSEVTELGPADASEGDAFGGDMFGFSVG